MVQSRPHPPREAKPPSSDEDSDSDDRPLFSWRQDPEEHQDNYYSEPPDPAPCKLLSHMDGYDSYGEPLEPNPAELSDTESASGADETVEENTEESPSDVLEYDDYGEPLESGEPPDPTAPPRPLQDDKYAAYVLHGLKHDQDGWTDSENSDDVEDEYVGGLSSPQLPSTPALDSPTIVTTRRPPGRGARNRRTARRQALQY